tara:strand:- start:5840 stop:6325 length:486 start_codon:yes stop_codon:yes gene_type:complete
MEVLIIILGFLLLLIGFFGSIVPAVPGPLLSYIAILILSLFTPYQFNDDFLVMWIGIVIVVTALDYWLQVYGVKKFGGKQKAINGTLIGLIVGLLAPIPFGFIIGPFAGAFIGAYIEEKDDLTKAFIIALGALAGFLSGTILKLAVSIYFAYEFIMVLLNG